MIYHVYTDGSASSAEGRIACSYFIRTYMDFIGIGGIAESGTNIGRAETYAVGHALGFLESKNRITKDDQVHIYVDCESVIDLFDGFTEPDFILMSNDKNVKEVYRKIKRVNAVSPITFKKIKAHGDNINGNKVADRVAKHILRNE